MSEETLITPEIRNGLREKRCVLLSGEIGHEMISHAIQDLLSLQIQSNDPITLIIESGGGGIDVALLLCDTMTKVMTAPVHGVALGICGSAATLIMLHCAKRMSTPYANFLIHSGTRSDVQVPMNQRTTKFLKQLLSETRRYEQQVIRLYMERLTPPSWGKETPEADRRKFVMKLIARGDQPLDEWMSAEEAIAAGLIQEIITERLISFRPADTLSPVKHPASTGGGVFYFLPLSNNNAKIPSLCICHYLLELLGFPT